MTKAPAFIAMTNTSFASRACLCFVVVATTVASSRAAVAAPRCDDSTAKIVSVEGRVEVLEPGRSDWRAAAVGEALCAGDLVSVRKSGRAAVRFDGAILTRLAELTTLEVAAQPESDDATLGLREGVGHFMSRIKRRVKVITPILSAVVDGTEFVVSSRENTGRVVVAEGAVIAGNTIRSERLVAGDAASVEAGTAPRRIEVSTIDAVKWAIHYPVMLWPQDTAAQLAIAQGDYAAARVGPESPVLRANILLALGQTEEAARELRDRTDADALAVRTVAAVAQHDAAQATTLVQQALAQNPASPAAHIAHSYVLQGRGALNEARDAAREATRLAPDNPLAWARRAELELGLSQIDAGETSAHRALAINPDTTRARGLLGFAQLLAGKLDDAAQTLAKAIDANASDPLARFARGLTRIRAGQLAEGRADIELAVLLDPSNAEYRATLGRAYMAEARDDRAETQLALASRLDPNTPTPWFFSAQRKLEQGDAIGAVRDGERALALNDNRLTLRSRALLDVDRAARGVTLGSAYQRLRFDGALKRIASDAVSADPASGPAHRLMAQAYGDDLRLETARVSEQFQSFIYGDVGDRPIAMQEFLPSLPILTGPRLLSLDETSSLFDRKPWHFSATALAGTQESWGTNVLASASNDQLQASVGHFEYRSAGFQPDSDIDLSGTRFAVRAAPTREITIFAEVQHRDLASRDITQSFFTDLDSVSQRERADVTRLGLRTRVGEAASLVAVMANESGREHRAESGSNIFFGTLFPNVVSELAEEVVLRNREVGFRANADFHGFRYIAGARRFAGKNSIREVDTTRLRFPPFFQPRSDSETRKLRTDSKQDIIFNRLILKVHPLIRLVGSVDYVNFERTLSRETQRFLPSVGIAATVTKRTRLRAAYQQGVSLRSVGDQHLEPTRFAGFDSVFDDLSGTRYRRAALALDHRFGPGRRASAQWSLRKLDVPNSVCGIECLDRWDERRHHVLYNQTLTSWLAFEVGWRYESLGLHTLVANTGSDRPERMRTEVVPVRVFAQWLGKWDAMLEGLKMRQDVFNSEPAGLERRSASFWMANARVTYSHPGRRWQLSAEVRNLFDQAAMIQDTDLLTDDPRTPLWYPERAVFFTARAEF